MLSDSNARNGAVGAERGGAAHWWLRTGLLLATVVLVGHGQALWGGLAFDDHLHRRALRSAGWSVGELTRAARVGQTGGLVEYWWAEGPAFWQPFRPLALALMKVQYAACAWQAAGMHAFGLAWHWGAAMLAAAVGRRLLGSGAAARMGAALFALHPGHATTAAWIACQNEVMGTFFVLGAVAAYGRFARWGEGRAGEPGGADAGRPVRIGAVVVTVICAGTALLCRETGVVVPVLIIWLDVLLGRGMWRRRVVVYAALGVLVAGYLLLRMRVLEGVLLPGREYMQRPGDAGFLRYAFDKLLFYYLGLYAYVPSLQLGVFEWFAAHRGALYGLAAVVAGALLLVVWAAVGLTRTAWALLGWSAIAVGPVLPVFAGSHHLYLASAGASLLTGAVLARVPDLVRSEVWRGRLRTVGAVMVVLYGAGTVFAVWQFQRVVAVEARWARAVAEACGDARGGEVLYVIDFPPLASFTPPAVAELLGVRELTVCALTVRPGGATASSIERVDDHTLRLRMPAAGANTDRSAPSEASASASGTFTRMAERQIMMLIPAAAGLPMPGAIGERRRGPGFVATDHGEQADGARVLELRFDEPFSSARHHFCAAEEAGAVRPVRFDRPADAVRGAGV